MPDFVPEPVHVDNWRDHAKWDGPVCSECGHPLWSHAINRDLTRFVCGGCDPTPIYYDGPPHLVELSVPPTTIHP
jgi:hypothetical protein